MRTDSRSSRVARTWGDPVLRDREYWRVARFDSEILRAQQVIGSQSGGIIWTGDAGMGKAALLTRLASEINREDQRSRAHILRFGAGLLMADGAQSETSPQEITALIESITRERVVVALVHDLDLLDAPTSEVLVALANTRHPRFVLLATARSMDELVATRRPISTVELPLLSTSEALELLWHGHGIEVAPCVASLLVTALAGNAGMILEIARQLSSEQLAGTSALPDPLPTTPVVEAVIGDRLSSLTARERAALLIAAVAVTDQTRVLCAAAELDVDALIRGPLCGFLRLVSGRFEISDPRVRAYAHSRATLGERTDAHLRLATVMAREPHDEVAVWHTSLAALGGDDDVTGRLISLARRVLSRGDAVWAHAIAREAASQATPAEARAAEFLAGLAALHSGHVDDAVDWLNGLIRSDDFAWSAKALSPFVVAVTYARGYVPVTEVKKVVAELEHREDRDGSLEVPSRSSYSVIVEALAIAASLQAERGELLAARELLTEGAKLASGSDGSSWLLDVSRRWCTAFGLESTNVKTPLDAPRPGLEGYSVLATALGMAGNHEWSAAVHLLTSSLLALAPSRRQSGLVGSTEDAATPLLEAHLRVALALSDAATGKLATARAALETAVFALPVRLPFAGLGVAALRRLCILVDGEPSAASLAMTELLSATDRTRMHQEHLTDGAVLAAYADDANEAAALMSLAAEKRSTHPIGAFCLPAPDEPQLWLAAGNPVAARDALARSPRPGSSPSTDCAGLRARLALATPEQLARLLPEATVVAQRVSSVFDRARLELEVGSALERLRDERGAKVHHLSAAECFLQSGVTAIGDALQGRMSRAAAVKAPVSTAAPSREPAATVTPLRLGDQERQPTWAQQLTDREVEIAALVVKGEANRDVARKLHLSVRTVETHLGRIFTKLGVHSRTQLGHLTRTDEERRSGVSAT